MLVDECLANASSTFSDDFICQFRPSAWANITLTYHKHFVDTGCDITISEIIAEVIRDSICTKRMDYLTMALAQLKRQEREQQQARCQCHNNQKPKLTVVKSNSGKDKT